MSGGFSGVLECLEVANRPLLVVKGVVQTLNHLFGIVNWLYRDLAKKIEML